LVVKQPTNLTQHQTTAYSTLLEWKCQIAKMHKLQIRETSIQTDTYMHTQYILALQVMHLRAQMWSLKTEDGKRNIVTSMWDINNSKLNNSTGTSKIKRD
jgi:hypothetical protein